MNPSSPSWLRVVRVSAFAIFGTIFVRVVLMYASLIGQYDPQDSSGLRLRWALPVLLSWFPYFWVFWRLRKATDAVRVKRALANAVAWGSCGALCFSGAAIALWREKDWRIGLILSILAIFQFALLGSAIKSYYSMEGERGDLSTLATRFVVIPPIAVLLAITIPSSSFLAMESHETSAADALRTINAAQAKYAKTHKGKGFASFLEELGPTPGAALIDEDLANGRRFNYTVTLNPVSPETSGQTTRYTLIARPQSYGDLGRRSFFSDESGVVRYTPADRVPTVLDRVLP